MESQNTTEKSLIRNQSSMHNVVYQQDEVESAGKLIDFLIQQDDNFCKLTNQLQLSEQVPCSISGLSDSDYPSFLLEGLPQIHTLSKVPLPNELVEQFRHMQCNCMMGLFPEINRSWLTIDSDIFIWNYEDGSDLAYFDGLSETILSVGLVLPKPGIFQSHIEYLLLLATSVEIVMLGVSFKQPNSYGFCTSEMYLLPDPLFSLPTDNSHVTTIKGIRNGRIFLGTKDCCLLELVYQAEDGWFSRKCRKINHSNSSLSFLIPGFLSNAFSENDSISQIIMDESRQILYTRSEKGTINVYDLEEGGLGMRKVAALSQHSIIQNAVIISRTIDRSNFHPIVHICPVETTESPSIHLVAITKSGVRLYFTTTSISAQSQRPRILQLLHVRLPPGFSSNSPPQQPKNVHKAQYSRGTSLLVSSQTEDVDVLWVVSNDSFSFQPILMEKQSTSYLDGHTWALSEIETDVLQPKHRFQPPSIVTQHYQPPRKFIFLSAQGSHIIMKLRPVDQLRKLLEDSHGVDSEMIKSFFSVLGIVQGCATSLILACSTSIQDANVSELATQAFLSYGSQSRLERPNVQPQNEHIGSPLNPRFSSYTPSVTSFAPQCISTPQSSYFQPQNQNTINSPAYLSGRHQGLYLYFSRIVRNFWNYPLLCEDVVKSPQGSVRYLTSTITGEQLGNYLESLNNLKQFLINNFRQSTVDGMLHMSQNHSRLQVSGMSRTDNKFQQNPAMMEVEMQEKKSILQLQQLITRICEVLGLWKIVCDHQIHVLISNLTKDQENRLRATSCKEFIISGTELATVLVNKLITQYLDDNATTDAISERLREVCPSIYRSEDVDCSKALEKIISAKKASNSHDKEQLLRESLQLCKKITPQLNLSMVAAQFQSVFFYDGIVDLCLTAALNRDPQNLAIHYYKNGQPVEDQQGMHACIMRMDAYKIITETLGQLFASSQSHPQSPSIPKQPGPPPMPDPNMLSPEQASQYSEHVLNLALQSDDELFHYSLYDWLVEMKYFSRLLQIKSPHFEAYLKRSIRQDNLAMLDLLWQYYEKNKCFSAAAKILAKLAEKHGCDINLQMRIEYLSRAVICIKSSEIRTLASNEGEFLHELEEKMEVARIQLQVLDSLQRYAASTVRGQEAINNLNSDLFDISQLYEQFAEPFVLPECQLAILHCAGHHDNSLIESLWQKIIDNEFSNNNDYSSEAKVACISNKIKILGKKYISSIRFFPLVFLVKYLEKKSCCTNLSMEWVVSTMFSIGISFPVLLDTYNKLYKSKDPVWQVSKKPLHLLEVLQHLISKFVEDPSVISMHERKSFKIAAQDAVSSYLIDLQTLAGTDSTTGNLISGFKSLQAKLERLS